MGDLQSVFGTGVHTFHTEDTFCAVFSAACVVGHVDFHGTDFFAFSAADALAFITGDPE